MLMKIYTVYDGAAEAYLPPFYFQAKGQALRSFSDTVNDPKSMLNHHPGDYTLFEIGVFDDAHATIESYETPHSLGKAVEFMNLQPPANGNDPVAITSG